MRVKVAADRPRLCYHTNVTFSSMNRSPSVVHKWFQAKQLILNALPQKSLISFLLLMTGCLATVAQVNHRFITPLLHLSITPSLQDTQGANLKESKQMIKLVQGHSKTIHHLFQDKLLVWLINMKITADYFRFVNVSPYTMTATHPNLLCTLLKLGPESVIRSAVLSTQHIFSKIQTC